MSYIFVLSYCSWGSHAKNAEWKLLFPPPVDYVLSELSAITSPSWLALHGMTYSSPELCKLFCHNEAMICNESQNLLSILYFIGTSLVTQMVKVNLRR